MLRDFCSRRRTPDVTLIRILPVRRLEDLMDCHVMNSNYRETHAGTARKAWFIVAAIFSILYRLCRGRRLLWFVF